MEFRVKLTGSYEDMSRLFMDLPNPNYCVKFFSRKNKFEEPINTYSVRIRGAEEGNVTNYLKKLGSRTVTIGDFEKKLQQLTAQPELNL